MEDDKSHTNAPQFGSIDDIYQPSVNWIPSPPSKKIKSYLKNSNTPKLCTISEILAPPLVDKIAFSDETDFDEFILSSEHSLLVKHENFNDNYADDQLFFTCTTNVEVADLLEEEIKEFISLQVTVGEVTILDDQFLLSVSQIKGITSIIHNNIQLPAQPIFVAISWDLFEKNIPFFYKENDFKMWPKEVKEATINQFLNSGDNINLTPVGKQPCPFRFKSISRGVFIVQSVVNNCVSILLKTGLIEDSVHVIPIFAPHLMITGSSIADAFFCDRRVIISAAYPLCDPEGELPESTEKMQLGNLIHFVFEKCLMDADFTHNSIISYIRSFKSQASNPASKPLVHPIFTDQSLQDSLSNVLQHWGSVYFPAAKGIPLKCEKPTIWIVKSVAVEFSIVLLSHGIQGKLDALVFTSTGKFSALEIKSGKPQRPNISHKAQAIIYYFLLSHFLAFLNLEESIFLSLISYIAPDFNLDIEESHSLEAITFTHFDFVSLLYKRNEIALSVFKGGHKSVLPFPSLKEMNSWKCSSCPVRRTCDRIITLKEEQSFFNYWHDALTTEQQKRLQFFFANFALPSFHASYFSFKMDSLLLVLKIHAENMATLLVKSRDPILLLCDYGRFFPNLILPIFNCTLIFKTNSFDSYVFLGIRLTVNPFTVIMKLSGKDIHLHDVKFYILKHERSSTGWRAQSSMLLDAIYSDTDYSSIFSKPLELSSDFADLHIFKKVPSRSLINWKRQYPKLDGILHPTQALIVANWLDNIINMPVDGFTGMSTTLHVVLGMPGCGKTRSVAAFIYQFLESCQHHEKLLITTFTHSAIDSILEKIQTLFPQIWPFLYKHNQTLFNEDELKLDDFPFLDQENIRPALSSNISQDPSNCRIFFSTVLGLSSLMSSNIKFKAVIVDEASQILLPLSLLPLRFAPIAILIGDHCQLRPLFSVASPRYTSISFSSFFETILHMPQSMLENNKSIKLSILKSQFRMNSQLASLCNEIFYSSMMQTDCLPNSVETIHWSLSSPANIPKPELFSVFYPNTLERSLVLIDISGIQSHLDIDKDILTSILLTYEYGLSPKSSLEVVVMAPYHAMLNSLKASVQNLKNTQLKVVFSTIDSMQGKESDFIILFLGDGFNSSNLMHDPRRLNVALSRASKKLVIVGSFIEQPALPSIWKRFLKWIKDNDIPVVRLLK